MAGGSPITRRTLLTGLAGGALVAGGTLLWNLRTAPGWIDAHAHAWSSDVTAYPRLPSKRGASSRRSFAADELFDVASDAGVSRVVLIQSPSLYGDDNRYLIDVARRHPSRYRIVGYVDADSGEPDRAMRELLPLRVTGFRVFPRGPGDTTWLDAAGPRAMWTCAAETQQAICCLIDASQLDALDAACARHPDTPVVVDHLAKIGRDGPIDPADVDALCRLARHPRLCVKLSGFHALGGRTAPYADLVPLVRRTYDAFGPERLMWGSDCPYQLAPGHGYDASLALVRDGLPFATDADRDWLLRGTAARVFGFDA